MSGVDSAVLADWMHGQGFLDRPALAVKPLTGGQSNPTFLLTSGAQKTARCIVALGPCG